MDGGAWWATVREVAKGQTGLERISTRTYYVSSHYCNRILEPFRDPL